jgi:hypothetical protein
MPVVVAAALVLAAGCAHRPERRVELEDAGRRVSFIEEGRPDLGWELEKRCEALGWVSGYWEHASYREALRRARIVMLNESGRRGATHVAFTSVGWEVCFAMSVKPGKPVPPARVEIQGWAYRCDDRPGVAGAKP